MANEELSRHFELQAWNQRQNITTVVEIAHFQL